MSIGPYLFFNGNCEEAFAFYRDALDAVPEKMMRYRFGLGWMVTVEP